MSNVKVKGILWIFSTIVQALNIFNVSTFYPWSFVRNLILKMGANLDLKMHLKMLKVKNIDEPIYFRKSGNVSANLDTF